MGAPSAKPERGRVLASLTALDAFPKVGKAECIGTQHAPPPGSWPSGSTRRARPAGSSSAAGRARCRGSRHVRRPRCAHRTAHTALRSPLCAHRAHVNDDFSYRTTSGGIITIAAYAFMLVLFLTETREGPPHGPQVAGLGRSGCKECVVWQRSCGGPHTQFIAQRQLQPC